MEISCEAESSQFESFPRKALAVEENTIVGVDDDILEIKARLCGSPSSKLQVVALVGMGGIGKTALARKVYEDPLVMHHFYLRAWITVSRQHRVGEMLLGLLRCVCPSSDEIYKKSEQQLAEELRRRLIGHKYLIVMDDVWSSEAWDDVKRCFPDDRNGSRIILTSRVMAVGVHAQPASPPHCLRPLDLHQSWELISQKVFGKTACPSGLEEIGKKIAERCGGLPLAIVVVAGSLAKVSKTRTSWSNFAKMVGSAANEQDKQKCLDILALSYHYLPCHLKPCFLYMGAFPEDYEIPAWTLIRLWIAEGFLPPETKLKSPEEVAEHCLEDLVSRSLVMVAKRRSDGGVKTCVIHDLLRELSLQEGEKENFMYVKKEHSTIYSAYAYNEQRLSFTSGVDIISSKIDTSWKDICSFPNIYQSTPVTSSFLSFGTIGMPTQSETIFLTSAFRLLRVLHLVGHTFIHFPVEITQLIHLKYLALSYRPEFPLSLSKLVNLQTLVLETSGVLILPTEMWEMEQLRHLHLKNTSFWPSHPMTSTKALSNLQTLCFIDLNSCTREVFISISNLKKLGITGSGFCTGVGETKWELYLEHWIRPQQLNGCLTNLLYLKRLETLKFCSILVKNFPCSDAFPPNLKKLSITMCFLVPKSVTTFSKLPNLEILKLKDVNFERYVFELSEQVFKTLKFLLIQSSTLKLWEVANSYHFPKLERLVLKHCFSLKEIPNEIGDIPTLEFMELHHSPAVEQCARRIEDEQRELGNDSFKVYINRSVTS
ncbi:putative late blight resistance protein homolog R1B-14 [Ipomoea triloba]|uniref:putative late blight resistance protein homolog R1B-14 n=1 Tax=Ipomoea triloba TaxID=35885 RepID=UPI00125E942C|nr:putative late blight resistance protein homolog R1B-14 [Ipomoea triloba]